MNRRDFFTSGASILALIAMHGRKTYGSVLDYQLNPVRGNTGIFTENGGTIAFHICTDGIAVVDSQFPESATHLIEVISQQSCLQIDYLINTHHHLDHTAGNIAFKGLANKVVAHENSRKNQMNVARERGNENEQLFPDTVFKDTWSGSLGKEKITATYFGRAHTDGDAVIHFENDNVVHMGDLVFNRRYPFVDMNAGASILNWIEVIDRILKTYDGETIFIFGHAADNYQVTGSKDDLTAMGNYLSKVVELVDNALKSGKSTDEIMKNSFIPGAREWTGGGIERSLTAAIQELSK